MNTKIQEFLDSEVGQITKFLFDKGWTMEQIIQEVQSEDSYQIECMGMYHCPSGRDLQSFIHHSRWGQKIKRQVKFLNLNYLKIEKALTVTNKKLGV